MNFASFPYIIFLLATLAIYFSCNKQLKPMLLLGASYFFYALFGFGFAALMLVTSAITYSTAYYSYYAKTKTQQRFFFYLGIAIDLLVFILFKYIHIIDIDVMNWPNWSAHQVLIPIGISFYTFKTIGYCIDVYKRKYAPEASFLYYALSVSFFPQLIAGPIEKSVVISQQLKNQTAFNSQFLVDGGKLILWGLFKKIVIADGIAQIINPVFFNVQKCSGFEIAIALLACAYQFYADFSGYSDIAIGSAKCFGIELPANFFKPFFSKNFFNFWSRWHSSFSRWLKEYVFDYALQGNLRQSNSVIIFKLWIVFLIVGLWHGASLNYILYAQIAFIFVVVALGLKKIFRLKPVSIGKWQKVIDYLSMISLFAFLGVFYKFTSSDDSLYVLNQFLHFKVSLVCMKWINLPFLLAYIMIFEALQYFQVTPTGSCFENIKHFSVRLCVALFMIFFILVVHSKPNLQFQYFQF